MILVRTLARRWRRMCATLTAAGLIVALCAQAPVLLAGERALAWTDASHALMMLQVALSLAAIIAAGVVPLRASRSLVQPVVAGAHRRLFGVVGIAGVQVALVLMACDAGAAVAERAARPLAASPWVGRGDAVIGIRLADDAVAAFAGGPPDIVPADGWRAAEAAPGGARRAIWDPQSPAATAMRLLARCAVLVAGMAVAFAAAVRCPPGWAIGIILGLLPAGGLAMIEAPGAPRVALGLAAGVMVCAWAAVAGVRLVRRH